MLYAKLVIPGLLSRMSAKESEVMMLDGYRCAMGIKLWLEEDAANWRK